MGSDDPELRDPVLNPTLEGVPEAVAIVKEWIHESELDYDRMRDHAGMVGALIDELLEATRAFTERLEAIAAEARHHG